MHSFYGLVHSFLRRCWFISKVLRLFRKIFAFFASYSAIIFDGLALGWYIDLISIQCPNSRNIDMLRYSTPAGICYLSQRHYAYRMACKLLFMSFLVRAKMMGVWRIFRQIVIVIHLSFDRWFEQFFVACSHFSPHKRIYLHLSIIHCFTTDCKRKNRINSRIAELFSRRCVDFFGYLLRS